MAAQVIQVIKGLAKDVTTSDADLASVALASHLFAVTVDLFTRDPTTEMREFPPPCIEVDAALDSILALDEASRVSDCYPVLLAAMRAIDADIVRSFNGRPRLPVLDEATALTTMACGEREVAGVVNHWLRPRSQLKQHLRRRQAVTSKYFEPISPQAFLENLGMQWERAGQASVAKRKSPPSFSDLKIVRGRPFKFALFPLNENGEPTYFAKFRIAPGTSVFCIDQDEPMSGAGNLEQILEDIKARYQDCQMLIFPELMIHSRGRDILRDWTIMPNRAVVPGSFHVWDRPGEAPWNESTFILAEDMLFRRRKLGDFRLTPKQQQHLRKTGALAGHGIDGDAREGIQLDREFQFADLSLGRIGVLICADAINATGLWLEEAVFENAPDLLVLVCMSSDTDRFLDFANRACLKGVSVLLVNHCSPGDGRVSVGCYTAAPELDGGPPGWVQWVFRGTTDPKPELEAYDFRSKSWLHCQHHAVSVDSLGLILDLENYVGT